MEQCPTHGHTQRLASLQPFLIPLYVQKQAPNRQLVIVWFALKTMTFSQLIVRMPLKREGKVWLQMLLYFNAPLASLPHTDLSTDRKHNPRGRPSRTLAWRMSRLNWQSPLHRAQFCHRWRPHVTPQWGSWEWGVRGCALEPGWLSQSLVLLIQLHHPGWRNLTPWSEGVLTWWGGCSWKF